jgi:ferrous iron transport protein B
MEKERISIVTYGREVEEHLAELQKFLEKKVKLSEKYNLRWIALKLLENDAEITKLVKDIENGETVLLEAERIRQHLKNIFGEDVETIIADARYGFIHGIVKEAVEKASDRISLSDQIDKIVMNRILGIPIFLSLMFLMFHLTFEIATPLSKMIDVFFDKTLSSLVSNALESSNTPVWVTSLLVDGVIAGVGSVLVFVPFIFMLFLIIAILEDSGYMARAAFVMDRIMHKIGLHGKSFIPMILGFGCNVPAVMATRILESRRDRILTILINPFMSCGARLPIYVLFAAAFFPDKGQLVIYSLYIIGIIVAIMMGFILKNMLFKGLSSPFVMELPPYRMPTITGVIIHMWERGWLFIKKAGTVIFTAVIIVWFLASMPPGVEYGSEESIIGMTGKVIAPIFAPLGFGNWQSTVSLVFGFIAKEIIVGTLGVLYGIGDVETTAEEAGLIQNLQGTFTPLSAYSFLIFVLLYVPCMATIAAIKREIGWKWAIFAMLYTTAVAWIFSFAIYQGGLLIGFR